VLSAVCHHFKEEGLIALNPAVALFQRPDVVHLLQLKAKVVRGDYPALSAVKLGGTAEHRADFVFAWHKINPQNNCI